MASQARASSARIRRHWEVLCREIGHRSAGSEGERRAADYIASQMRKHGLDDVTQQSFTFPGWTSSRCTLRVGPTRPTRPVHSARASVYSVATPGGGVQGKLAYLQSGLPDDFHQPLRGRIGLLIGALPLGDEQVKQRLARSGLKALLNVDTRVPFAWPTSNGAAPQWVDGYHLPTAGLAYADAVALAEQMPLAAHLNMRTRCLPDTSQNVLGQRTGWEHPDQVIVVSGHHDCVDETVGADDNGSGVIFMLELARLFARRRVRRTIRFVSYGVEERLSVGSYVHMRSLTPAQRRQVVLAINADAVSSTVGSDVVRVTGTRALLDLTRRTWQRHRHPAEIEAGLHAYSDHFPFNMVGVPSLSLGRPNLPGGSHWQLHSVHDDIEHVSADVLARTVDTTADLLQRVANAPRLPVPRRVDPPWSGAVARAARSLYRHPWDPDSFDYDR